MLGFGPISTSPISVLPDNLITSLSVSFVAVGILEASLEDPYASFVRNPTARLIYSAEIEFRAA